MGRIFGGTVAAALWALPLIAGALMPVVSQGESGCGDVCRVLLVVSVCCWVVGLPFCQGSVVGLISHWRLLLIDPHRVIGARRQATRLHCVLHFCGKPGCDAVPICWPIFESLVLHAGKAL